MKVNSILIGMAFSTLAICNSLTAQSDSSFFSRQLFISEDNDFINIRGAGTDKAYTHGFRIELLYNKNSSTNGIFDRLLPKAGVNSTSTYSWAMMQTMITPDNLSRTLPDSSDYRYACSITAMHSCYSINASKKYAIGSELVIGLMGKPSLGKETQMGMHRLMNDEIPRGWNTELKTALLFNVNLYIERKLLSSGRRVEIIGGAKTYMGTSLNAVTVYSLVRIGKFQPYFSNVFNRSASLKGWQVYAVIRPSMDLVLHNALIQGALFRRDEHIRIKNGEDIFQQSHRTMEHVGTSLDYGLVVTRGEFSISFTQRSMYAMIKEQNRHEVGNVSLYFILK